MKILWFDCSMGAAGDMIASALFELIPNKAAMLQKLNSLGLPGVTYSFVPSVKCGIKGTGCIVSVNGSEEDEHLHEHHEHHDHKHHEHHHRGMDGISHIVSHLQTDENIKAEILSVYRQIAEAESAVHGVPVEEIHFHEVGTMDAVADVAAAVILIREIAPDRIVASPVHVGAGTVKCAHGILPVPAPATAYILKNVPVYGGSIQSELCTPTGAALLKHFAYSFGEMPLMSVESIGYGMGKKDFPAANCIRAFLGCSEASEDEVYSLECNVDDMTAEEIAFAVEMIFASGARDVYTTPCGMKKSRQGTLISVLCDECRLEECAKAIFKYTSTIGIREQKIHRRVMDRRIEIVHTPYGDIRCKISSGYGTEKRKFEYEDLASAAKANEMSIAELLEEIRQ